jgi:hypothetical protein
MRTGLGCKLNQELCMVIETLNELNVHNYDSLTGSSMNTYDSLIKESKIDTTVHTYRAVLKNSRITIHSSSGWSMPVKYKGSKQIYREVQKSLKSRTNIETKNKCTKSSNSISNTSETEAIMHTPHTTMSCSWNRFIVATHLRIQQMEMESVMGVTHMLNQMFAVEIPEFTNTLKYNKDKSLIKTKDILMRHTQQQISAVIPQTCDIASKLVKSIQCLTFHDGAMTILSDGALNKITDMKSVRAVRRMLKIEKPKLNLWSKSVGTDIIYYTQQGRQLKSYSIIKALTTLQKTEGTVPIWEQAIRNCGLVATDSDIDDDLDEYLRPTPKGVKKKRGNRGGKRKESNSVPEPTNNKDPDSDKDQNEGDASNKKKHDIKIRRIKIRDWRLAQLNIADIRRFTKLKWKGLAQIMDDKKLHGIALQELRVPDAATFTANQKDYPGLTLLVEPTSCVQGENGGSAGGLGFLVRTELLDQGLFSQITHVKSNGFYGQDNLAYIEVKVGSSTLKWVNVYARPARGKSYEWDKISSMCSLKGDKIVMGDINASVVYSRPTEI